ncbi:MAG: exodeoxyribonuclease VII small subunit [Clostridia bacterium]|nr:exodeoxyribonuclease VII small subunit [Clostridia bacterium]MBR6008288.1 exodeoxyribonuclease VII small subunit [Clostridia bacterium]MBR6499244.1 exodeoxyribonuclease VII small subunit [Clostridia bacterium]
MEERFTFEAGMAELEEIVSALEKGEMSLDGSFKAYQRGVQLYSRLKALLDEGDRKIIELTSEGEKLLQGGEEDE